MCFLVTQCTHTHTHTQKHKHTHTHTLTHKHTQLCCQAFLDMTETMCEYTDAQVLNVAYIISCCILHTHTCYTHTCIRNMCICVMPTPRVMSILQGNPSVRRRTRAHLTSRPRPPTKTICGSLRNESYILHLTPIYTYMHIHTCIYLHTLTFTP
jgi:hypothetical protein